MCVALPLQKSHFAAELQKPWAEKPWPRNCNCGVNQCTVLLVCVSIVTDSSPSKFGWQN